ncbi:PTS sugar transporter subunit IIA [Neobacillus pocheonensis]|uniref:PTS sugar transporter subunit IIA n=1 Tax=Neobacillus pocheonensis TaxID=363869 RepID=A0ABT0WGB3_9BACI|nr:PTS sugar transporter subunit IIA [Neobacillus pocheonensis]
MKMFYYIQLDEQDFFIRFVLHLRNLLVRARNNYFSKNPLKDGIKTACPLIYDISVSLAKVIKQKTEVTINDDEIAYIAFHLGSAIGSHKILSTKITAVIFCPNYYDINLRLADSINRHFSSDILITNILTDESELKKISPVDFIISTLPIAELLNFPIVQIGLFLNGIDINSIREKMVQIKIQKKQRHFEENLRKLIVPELFEINNDIKNEVDAIHHMVKKLEAQHYVWENFEAEILEREKMSSTAFNLFAIPHSMEMHAKKTGLSVLISENDIVWSNKPIQLVIMLCFKANERQIFNEIFDPITIILSDINNINKLIKCREYNEFIETMVSMYNWKCHPDNVQF